MEKKIWISKQHAIFLVSTSATGNMIYSSWTAVYAGRANWICVGLGISLMIPFALWILYLGGKYPGNNIFDILKATLGKYVSGLVAVIYIAITFVVAITTLALLTQTVKAFFLQFTPAWIIIASVVLISTVITTSGIRKIADLCIALYIIAIGTFYSIYLLIAIKDFRIEHVIPIFDTSFLEFAKGVLIAAGIVSESLLFIMVMVGSIKETRKYYYSIIKGISLWALLLSGGAFIAIGISSAELYKRLAYVGVTSARLIQIGEFFRGLEVVILATYQVFNIMCISLHLYSIQTCAISILNRNIPGLLPVLAALLIIVPSLWKDSYNKAYFFLMHRLSYITLAFSIAVLLLASISMMFKRKKRNKPA